MEEITWLGDAFRILYKRQTLSWTLSSIECVDKLLCYSNDSL